MTKIFISYRRKDDLTIAHRIHDQLEDHFGSDTVFIDMYAIPPGVDYRAYLKQAVTSADVVLAVIGDGWVTACDERGTRRLDDPDDLVRIEIEVALVNSVPVIPLLIGAVAMPSPEELPDSLRILPSRQAVSINPGRDFHVHMDRLIGDLEKAGVQPHADSVAKHSEPNVLELSRFNAVKTSDDPEDCREFLFRFPKSQLADLVSKRLRVLEDQEWGCIRREWDNIKERLEHKAEEIRKADQEWDEVGLLSRKAYYFDNEDAKRINKLQNAIQIFLNRYPDSTHLSLAEQISHESKITLGNIKSEYRSVLLNITLRAMPLAIFAWAFIGFYISVLVMPFVDLRGTKIMFNILGINFPSWPSIPILAAIGGAMIGLLHWTIHYESISNKVNHE